MTSHSRYVDSEAIGWIHMVSFTFKKKAEQKIFIQSQRLKFTDCFKEKKTARSIRRLDLPQFSHNSEGSTIEHIFLFGFLYSSRSTNLSACLILVVIGSELSILKRASSFSLWIQMRIWSSHAVFFTVGLLSTHERRANHKKKANT